MKKDYVDGRETAQPCQCIQPGWLPRLHLLLDASGEPLGHNFQFWSKSPGPLFPGSLVPWVPWSLGPCLYAVTSDPTFSPSTTRRIFPGWFMLKMIIGRLLSLHKLTAVRSITFRPSCRISM